MRRSLVAVLLLGGCGTLAPSARSCGDAPPAPLATLEPSGRTRNVILVTLDGVRWQDVLDGVEPARARAAHLPGCKVVPARSLVPNLSALARAGVVLGGDDATMVSSGPSFVSLPGYRELLTGRAGGGCTHNLCSPIDEPTLLDELRAHEHVAPEQLAVIASWERLERAAARDPSAIALSAGRHGGATRDRLRVSAGASSLLDRAAASSAYPGWLDYRPDRFTTKLALEYLQARRPRFLHVALGDTDEHAHRGDYAGYLEALRDADRFVGELWATLATMDTYGAETTVIVTTDHGRARSFAGHGGGAPESARVWLVAAGGAIHAQGGGALRRHRLTRLADLAPTLRAWYHLPPDTSARAGVPIEALVPAPVPAVLAARGE